MSLQAFDLRRAVHSSLRSSTCYAVFIVALALQCHVYGHEDLELQIKDTTKQIQQQPGSAELYLRRGELYRLRADWTNALSDYAAALNLNSNLLVVHRARGQMFFEAGRLADAVAELNLYVRIQPGDPAGHSVRGRTFFSMGRFSEAAADFERATTSRATPEINDYLDWARAVAAEGTNQIDQAVAILDQGIKRFGNALLLQNLAVEYEMSRGRRTDALKRLEDSMSSLPRKEWWHVRRAEILELSGQPDQALAAYETTKACIAALPSHLQGTRAVRDLETNVLAAITRLRAPTELRKQANHPSQ